MSSGNTLDQGETVMVQLSVDEVLAACTERALAKIGEIEGRWSSCLKLNISGGKFIDARVHVTREVPK